MSSGPFMLAGGSPPDSNPVQDSPTAQACKMSEVRVPIAPLFVYFSRSEACVMWPQWQLKHSRVQRRSVVTAGQELAADLLRVQQAARRVLPVCSFHFACLQA